MHGIGQLDHSDGSRYVGEFKMDKAHGKGRFMHIDGRTYEGDWENDSMHGFGTFSWPDGTQYVGAWKHGRKNHKCVKGYLNLNIEDVSELDSKIYRLHDTVSSSQGISDEESSCLFN